jgi:hypothetical protein
MFFIFFFLSTVAAVAWLHSHRKLRSSLLRQVHRVLEKKKKKKEMVSVVCPYFSDIKASYHVVLV